MKPQLDPVPVHEMPMKRWWVSPHHDHWYYHTPREAIVVPNLDVLEKTLDPCLKELAISLNRLGCITLPSCQGMHDDERNALKRDQAYDYLQLDAQHIKSQGLVLTDVETGESLIYYDPYFVLPWKRKDFVNKDKKKNKKPQGYLPFICFNPMILSVLAFIVGELPNVAFTARHTHLGIIGTIEVFGETMQEQCKTWRWVGEKLCSL